MATSSGNSDRMYKYDSIRIESIRYFERHDPLQVGSVKNYFSNFHRLHPGFLFSITKVFDGTTQILVDGDGYAAIKRELERKTRYGLPEVSYIGSPEIKDSILYQKAFSSFQDYMECFKDLKRGNDAIFRKRQADARLHARKLKQSLISRPSATFLAFDTEMYEHDHKSLLEIGFVKFKVSEGDRPEYFHLIITDNEHLKNGDNVPDNRNNFRFGKSVRMRLCEAAAEFQRHITGADYLVVHGGREDKKLLAELGVFIQGKEIFDTQVLALALLPTGPKHWGLKRMMGELCIDYDESILHNGGNDAHYTMKAFIALARKARMHHF